MDMKTTRIWEWRLRRWLEMKKKQPVKFYILITIIILSASVALIMTGNYAVEQLRQATEAGSGQTGGGPGESGQPVGVTEESETEQIENETEENGETAKSTTARTEESRASGGESQSSAVVETEESSKAAIPESTESVSNTDETTVPESSERDTDETQERGTAPAVTRETSSGGADEASVASEGASGTTGGTGGSGTGGTTGGTGGSGTSGTTGGTGGSGTSGTTGGTGGSGTSGTTGGTGGSGTSGTTGGTGGSGTGGTTGGTAAAAQPKDNTSASSRYSVSDYGPGDTVSDGAVNALGKDAFFSQSTISDAVFERIYGKSFKEGSLIPREDLRYILVLYYDFNGNRKRGELISNKAISQDLVDIFKELYDHRYPIDKIRLIDEYDADDDRSSSSNNSSCFNYRTVAGKSSLSLHAKGLAIDINPKYNPTVTTDSDGKITECFPDNASEYADRSKQFAHKIDTQDLCYRLFTERGFVWGGNWSSEPAYMHFSKSAVPEQ